MCLCVCVYVGVVCMPGNDVCMLRMYVRSVCMLGISVLGARKLRMSVRTTCM